MPRVLPIRSRARVAGLAPTSDVADRDRQAGKYIDEPMTSLFECTLI